MLPQIFSPNTGALIQRMLPVVFTLVLLAGVIFDGMGKKDDPYRCKALQNNGTWLNPADVMGDRFPFTNYQPDGCMLRKYSKDDIHKCMEGRHMVFSGDSTTRQIFWGMARMLDRKKANKGRKKARIHESYDMEFDGIRMRQIWNPWLETGDLNKNLTEELQNFTKEKHHPVPIKDQKSAAFVFLGVGSWYSAGYRFKESQSKFTQAYDNVTEIINLGDLPVFGEAPMDPLDGVGNELFIAPVAPPDYAKLPHVRTGPKGIHKGEIEGMDDILDSMEKKHNLRLVRAIPKLSETQPGVIVDPTQTGMHVIDSVAEIKALILLNLRCNAKLDRLDKFPRDRTCCSDYGTPTSWIQTVLVFAIWIFSLACVVFEIIDIIRGSEKPLSAYVNMKTGIFGVALLFCFYADRTQMFAKGSKQFVQSEFVLLSIPCILAGLLTFKAATPRAPRPSAAPAAASDVPATPAKPIEQDLGVLARDQTEEWKGWMQAAILIYHWCGASSNPPIYFFIRLLVAAYLFQTGYGHTIYFLVKKDFSFRRILATMLRLNMLSCALPYIMDTDYMFYYFAPLVSFWFMIVWFTMWIGNKYNDRTSAVLVKIGVMFVATWAMMNMSPVMEWIFWILETVFRIQWNLKEWTFRVNLDICIVFVGMLAGVCYARIERNSSFIFNYVTYIIPSIMALGYYYYMCAGFESKKQYTAVHPYYSAIPIIAFIFLRNATARLRNIHSAAAAWLGRCSLETFILQFHIFLAADTKGLLLVDGFKRGDGSLINDRYRDLMVVVPIFLWISHLVAESSGYIVKLVMTKPKEPQYDDDDENGLKFEEPAWSGYNLLGGKTSTFTRALRKVRSCLVDLRVQSLAILGVMWLLNLLY